MSSAWVHLFVAVVTEISLVCSLKAISYYCLGKIFIAVPFFTELHKYVASRSRHAIFASRVDVRHLDNAWLYWNSSFWSFFLSRKSY